MKLDPSYQLEEALIGRLHVVRTIGRKSIRRIVPADLCCSSRLNTTIFDFIAIESPPLAGVGDDWGTFWLSVHFRSRHGPIISHFSGIWRKQLSPILPFWPARFSCGH